MTPSARNLLVKRKTNQTSTDADDTMSLAVRADRQGFFLLVHLMELVAVSPLRFQIGDLALFPAWGFYKLVGTRERTTEAKNQARNVVASRDLKVKSISRYLLFCRWSIRLTGT